MSNGRSFWFVIMMVFCLTGASSRGFSRSTHIEFAAAAGTDSPSKLENGFLIIWRDTVKHIAPRLSEADPEARIKILDDAAREQAVCHVFAAVKAADTSATGVSIWDVSARKPGFIAVAAVYPRANGSPIALLLYFDWNGSLLQRTMLGNQHEIRSLEIGGDGNVWALNDFDPENRSRFVFTEYARNGAVIQEAVRSRRQWSTDESMSKGGQTSFGVAGGKIWAWLPKNKTFILFDGDTRRTAARHTGFPPIDKSSNLYARRAALLPDGQLSMELLGAPPRYHRGGWFIWSDRSGWQEVHK